MTAPPIYTDSKGVAHDIATMPYPFLVNALAKLDRIPLLGGDASAANHMAAITKRNALIVAMMAEIARRNVIYAASVPGLPTAELTRALADMSPPRRAQLDWTPERQMVFDAVTAELERRTADVR